MAQPMSISRSLSYAANLIEARDWRQAQAVCRSILEQEPGSAGALHLLGLALFGAGRQIEGMALLQRSIALKPDCADFHNNLGTVLGKIGNLSRARSYFAEAVRMAPRHVSALANLAVAMEATGDGPGAENVARQALAVAPTSVPALCALAEALRRQGRLLESTTEYQECLRRQPRNAQITRKLAGVLEELGRLDEALTFYRRAVELDPRDSRLHSALLYSLLYDPRCSWEEVAAQHHQWARRHADPLRPRTLTFPNDRSPERLLRIGYISEGFREHPIARIIEPVMREHDRAQFEAYCYADVISPDAVTRRLQALAAVWRDTHALSDEELAEQVRGDQIDVLVDPASHMAGSRLLVFARKPAPVQIAFPGYPATAAMHTIDAFITDPYQNSPGQLDETSYTERLVRLPASARCYSTAGTESPPVGPLPAKANGFVTFGSLNRLVKVSRATVALWARILRSVPGSRLLLYAGSHGEGEGSRQHRRWLMGEGVDEERIVSLRTGNRLEYLEQFNRVDIALDTFPYNGATTTCDALWMGVPVITLAGHTHPSRVGLSLLTQVGLTQCVARSADEYAAIAIKLADELPQLDAIRASLRGILLKSPLMDAAGYTRQYEEAIREEWHRWCRSAAGNSTV